MVHLYYNGHGRRVVFIHFEKGIGNERNSAWLLKVKFAEALNRVFARRKWRKN